MPKKNILRKLGLKKKYEDLVLLPLGTVVLLILCVLIFGFGLDKKFTAGTATGYIVDNSARPVSNAVICIEDHCVTSSQDGYFKLDDLPVGEKQISISSQQHNDINQKIRLSRGENSINLSLTPAELTGGLITLTSIEQPLFSDDLQITINDKNFNLETFEDMSKAEINLSDLKTGVYKFKMTSDYYLDQELDLVFEPGIQNLFPIVLEPAAEFQITVLDWLDNSSLKDTAVTIGNETVGETNIRGNLQVSNISVLTKEIKLKKDNYLRKTVSLVDLTPGENPEVIVQLIPTEKVAYTRSSASGKQIIISNYDGSEQKQLTTSGNNHSPWIDQDNQRVYFRKETENSRDSVYYVDYFGEETEVISTEDNLPKRHFDIIDYKNDIRHYLEETESETKILMSSKLDDSSKKEILTFENQEVNNIISAKDHNMIVYGLKNLAEGAEQQEGVFMTTSRFTRTSKILDYSLRVAVPQALSDDNKYLALTIDNDIFFYTFSDKSLVRLTSDNQPKSEIQFAPKQSKLSYLSDNGEFKALMLIDLKDHGVVQLSSENLSLSSHRWEKPDVFSYLIEDQLYIVSLKNKDFPQLVAEPVSY